MAIIVSQSAVTSTSQVTQHSSQRAENSVLKGHQSWVSNLLEVESKLQDELKLPWAHILYRIQLPSFSTLRSGASSRTLIALSSLPFNCLLSPKRPLLLLSDVLRLECRLQHLQQGEHRACVVQVYSIREAATSNLAKLAREFGPEWARDHLVPQVPPLSHLLRLPAACLLGGMHQVQRSLLDLNAAAEAILAASWDFIESLASVGDILKGWSGLYPCHQCGGRGGCVCHISAAEHSTR